MHIVYLDQNKWIDLYRAVKSPAEHPELRAVLEFVIERVKTGRLTLPLTSTNIYETQKINSTKRRRGLAGVQAALSQGLVFRGRRRRLEAEVGDVLRGAYGLQPLPRESTWFLSNVFFESFMDWDDPRQDAPVPESFVNAVRSDPPFFLFDYLVNIPEDTRVFAVLKFSEGSEKLRKDIEDRRKRHAKESLSMRRRIQSAMLMINELDLILEIAKNAELSEVNENDLLRRNARKIINESPTYFIEREIALRIEAQARPIDENDFRDMQAFCAVAAYADVVVAENQFSNLAKQAGLDRKYKTRILTDLLALPEHLEAG